MGFVVSKKIGNAVVRNRVTRRLREIVRPHLETLPAGSAIVLRALPGHRSRCAHQPSGGWPSRPEHWPRPAH